MTAITLRRSPYRRPGRRLLVLCGTQLTEYQYLRGLCLWAGTKSVSVRRAGRVVAPVELVEWATEHPSRADFDELWCVTDVDQYEIGNARTRADDAGVRLAVSNPCFEIWMLLHFEECHAWVKDCGSATRMLRRHIPTYRKSVDFGLFAKGLDVACTRARILTKDSDEPYPNPSSGVWQLVQTILRSSTTENQ